MKYEEMSIADLEAALAKCESAIESQKVMARHIQTVLAVKRADSNAAAWGLTSEDYDKAKAAATAAGEPLHVHLNRARAATLAKYKEADRLESMRELRSTQSAKTGVAEIKGKVVK